MRGIALATRELIAVANEIRAEDHPQTLRQLHYQISRGGIDYENDAASYHRLSRVLTAARRAYRQWELHGVDDDPPGIAFPLIGSSMSCASRMPSGSGETSRHISRPYAGPFAATFGRTSPTTWSVGVRRRPCSDRCAA